MTREQAKSDVEHIQKCIFYTQRAMKKDNRGIFSAQYERLLTRLAVAEILLETFPKRRSMKEISKDIKKNRLKSARKRKT